MNHPLGGCLRELHIWSAAGNLRAAIDPQVRLAVRTQVFRDLGRPSVTKFESRWLTIVQARPSGRRRLGRWYRRQLAFVDLPRKRTEIVGYDCFWKLRADLRVVGPLKPHVRQMLQ